MEIEIKRKMRNKYIYEFENRIVGETNYTFGFLLRKIKVSYKNDEIILKQTNWILRLINCLPILNLETFTPFKYYINGVYHGISKKIFFKPVFKFFIKDKEFELVQHNGNYISLTQNSVQVALYKKDEYTLLEENKYNIKYEESGNISLHDLIIFCIFIDVIFYSNHGKIAYWKKERNIIINDKYSERVKWKPYNKSVVKN